MRYQDLPDRDHAGGSIPAEVDAFGRKAPMVIFKIPRRRGDPIGPGGALKRAGDVADRIVYVNHRSARSRGLQPDRHLSGHDAWADDEARQVFNRKPWFISTGRRQVRKSRNLWVYR